MSEWQETRHSPPGIRNRRRGGGWGCWLGGRETAGCVCLGGGGIEPKNPIVETVNMRC